MFLKFQTHVRSRNLYSVFSGGFRVAHKTAFVLVVAAWSIGSLNAQSPTLIQDLYPGSEPAVSGSHLPVALGSVALFNGPGTAGFEPWVTDGTTLGTLELRDVFPGPDSGLGFFESGVINGSVLFSADDGVRGAELWASDGTAAGTVLLKEIFPGSGDGRPRGFFSDGNNVYFTANDGVSGAALWISDGTAVGTQQLVDLTISTNPFMVIASNFASNGTLVFFRGFSDGDGYELFATDGTTAGTYQVADIQIGGGSSPANLVALGSTVLFSADDGVNDRELWKSDGTAPGTVRVAEINPTGNANPQPMGIVGADLLFSADDGINGRELWKTDGNTVTRLTNVSGSVGTEGDVLDGRLLFAASDGSGLELWRSNGLPGGTGFVADIQVGPFGSSPQNFLTVGDRVVFSADDGTNGREPWITNGITAQLMANLDNGPDDSLSSNAFSPNAVLTDGRLLFSAGPSSRTDLWLTDGSAVGTVKLTDEETPRSSTPRAITAWNGGVAFLAQFDEGRHDLYESDGTLPGTSSANILSPTVADENQVGAMIEVGGTLFLVNEDERVFPNEVDLWTWDGTTASEVASDFGSTLSSGPKNLTAADATLVFSDFLTLHRNDGAVVGDAVNGVIPGAPALCSGQADELVALGSQVVFGGNSAGDCELWVVDLTDNTSTLLMDFDPVASSTPDIVGVFEGKAVFLLREGAAMGELWTTNGTVAGTQAIGASIPFGFFLEGGATSTAFFLTSYDASDDTSKIWKTDGSAPGTSLLLSLPASEGVLVFLGAVDAGAYFGNLNGIWFSDGTVPGTTLVAPGVQHLQAVQTHREDLVFAATLTAGEGRELFKAHGIRAAFEALPDLEPGETGTAITEALVVGDTLYLSAFREDVGTELFELDLSGFPSDLFGDGLESGNTGAWTIVTP